MYGKLTDLYSHWKDFVHFITLNVGTAAAERLNFPDNEVPSSIAAWIYLNCDIPDAEKRIRMECQGLTFSTALRMHASISFHYNQVGHSGNWIQMKDGSWSGNPSLSSYVSRYILSLQRRKVLASPFFYLQRFFLYEIATFAISSCRNSSIISLIVTSQSRRDFTECLLYDVLSTQTVV